MRSAVALVAALVACVLGAGCAQPDHAQAAGPVADDGVTYAIVRANVTQHPVAWNGGLMAPLCVQACVGEGHSAAAFDVADPAAVLWHVNVTLDWQSQERVPGTAPDEARLALYVIGDCATKCTRMRLVAAAQGASPQRLVLRDVPTYANETGLRLVVEEHPHAGAPGGSMQFRVLGVATALSPAGPWPERQPAPAGSA